MYSKTGLFLQLQYGMYEFDSNQTFSDAQEHDDRSVSYREFAFLSHLRALSTKFFYSLVHLPELIDKDLLHGKNLSKLAATML